MRRHQTERRRTALVAEPLKDENNRPYLVETASSPDSRPPAAIVALPNTPDGTANGNVGVKVSTTISEKLLRTRVDPVRAPLMRQARMQGTVTIEFTVTPTGDVSDSKVLQSPNEFLKSAATDAVGQWKYNPYFVNGQPTAMRTTADLKF